jgi:3-hydroxy acid dehydrogenase / malonic semialdehyde reductase
LKANMKEVLKNKIVMITGASSGFGAATAKIFAREGAKLVLIARREERLNILKGELEKKYQVEICCLPLDVAHSESVIQKLGELPETFATPDVLINNAGTVRGLSNVWEVKPEEWDVMIDTNVKGVLSMCSQIIPKMLEKNQGHIINVSSVSGHAVYPGGGVYCSTKHALRALTDTLRMELVASPLRVSMISPGMSNTEFSGVRFHGDHEKAEKVYEGLDPLLPEDVAEAILFIASRPPNVSIADLIIYPTHQASVSLVHRKGSS